MIGSLSVEALRPEHDRTSFTSGVAALDRYLREIATQDIRRRLSNCFVATDGPATIAGYYTFAATGIPFADLAPEETRRLPRYPSIPAALVGRLAVDQRYRGLGLGAALIADAITRAVRAETAIYALVVDAKDDSAVRFYRHHAFRPLSHRPMTLFLPIAEGVRRLASA